MAADRKMRLNRQEPGPQEVEVGQHNDSKLENLSIEYEEIVVGGIHLEETPRSLAVVGGRQWMMSIESVHDDDAVGRLDINGAQFVWQM